MASKRSRNIAMKRLQRDLIELERANIPSISALPLDDNIFEWHVNIQPTDGVYSGVYFHLIMTFPYSYPNDPPSIKICTSIKHPNISGSSLCLSMLRSHGETTGPYASWSNTYSITSILMQLQSFLFAEKIDQYGGYKINANLSSSDVKYSISICKSFKCKKCSHSHSNPWPKVKEPKESLIKIFTTDSKSDKEMIQSNFCQDMNNTNVIGAEGRFATMVGGRADFGCKSGKVFFEGFLNWLGTSKSFTAVGFGTEKAINPFISKESFCYAGSGSYEYMMKWTKLSRAMRKGDTCTIAVDFDTQRIYFAENGKLVAQDQKLYIPKYLQGKVLYPIISMQNARGELNFGKPRKPCKWLLEQGFVSLEDKLKDEQKQQDDNKEIAIEDREHNVNWHDYHIIDELWIWIFECLQVDELFNTKFICKKWYILLNKYNIMERYQICCYFTKSKLAQAKGSGGDILGIGLSITSGINGYGVDFKSQMDILSLTAWKNGCRIGVWGEELTQFLPLVMNKKHAEIADDAIHKYLEKIMVQYRLIKIKQYRIKYQHKTSSIPDQNKLDKKIDGNKKLQLVDTLITMMNQIVVQFVMGINDNNININNVSMIMCEKVILGYCALHHLLLYLKNKHKPIITNFANQVISNFISNENGCNKTECRDLGKLLIWLMISDKYQWRDIADIFVEEVFTRNVRWMVQDSSYEKYNTTKIVNNRVRDSFQAAKVSRRLVMFQVWFMKNNKNETLQGYHHRLGRPKRKVRNEIVAKTKFILNCKSWLDYFNELDIIIKGSKNGIDQLLRFAIYNSDRKGYHYTRYGSRGIIKQIRPPRIQILSKRAPKEQKQVQQQKGKGKGKVAQKQNPSKAIQSQPGNLNHKAKRQTIAATPTQKENETKTVSKAQRRKRRKNNNNKNGNKSIQNQQNQKLSQSQSNGNEETNEPKPVSKAQRRKRRKKGNKNGNEAAQQNGGGNDVESVSNTIFQTHNKSIYNEEEQKPVSKAQRRKRRKKGNKKNNENESGPMDQNKNATKQKMTKIQNQMPLQNQKPPQYQNATPRPKSTMPTQCIECISGAVSTSSVQYQQTKPYPEPNTDDKVFGKSTVLCPYFMSERGCALGEKCNYRHYDKSMENENGKKNSGNCKLIRKEYVPLCEYDTSSTGCALGQKCNYRHMGNKMDGNANNIYN